MHVHTRKNGGLGAISRRALDVRIDSGEVAPDDVFWFPGMSDWGQVLHHPELFADLDVARHPPSPLHGLVEAPADSETPVVHTGSDTPRTAAPTVLDPATRSSPDDPVLVSSHTWDELASESLTQAPLLPKAVPSDPPPTDDALVPTETDQAFSELPSRDHLDPAREPPPPYAPQSDSDRNMDAIFSALMQDTLKYRDASEFARSIDEVFLGAVITATLDAGRVLTDIMSDGTHHFLRFVSPTDDSRVLVRLTHLTGNLTTSRVQGHMASVVVGYGERMPGFADIWSTIGQQPSTGLVPRDAPGAFIVDGDLASQHVYVQVRLYLRIDDYVDHEWSINYAQLSEHLAACTRALRIHLHGRFG